jgi:hypothetical protein
MAHILSHRSGIRCTPAGADAEMLVDWRRMSAAIAELWCQYRPVLVDAHYLQVMPGV